MKTKWIEDGNFQSWLRLCLVLIGMGMVAIALGFDMHSGVARIVLLSGFGIALVGGMTSRAAMLKIKPFDNSYKKAPDSYKVKDDEVDKPR